MGHWNPNAAEPEWVRQATDQEIVERFWQEAQGRWTHEAFGRTTRAMRRRLYKILLDGLTR